MSPIRMIAGVFALALALNLLAQPASAEYEKWTVAMGSDSEIMKFVDGLEGSAPGADDAAALILYRGIVWDVLPGARVLIRNLVLRVNEGAQIADIASGLYLDARGIVGDAAAFRIRDGKLTRPEVTIQPGDGAVKRAQIQMDLADLQPGDILGATSVTRFDNILYFDKVPLGLQFPVANFRLTVHCEGDHLYEIRPENYGQLDVEELFYDDSRPVEWVATASGIPGLTDFRGSGPYAPGTPLALIAESSEYVPAAQDWVPMLNWSRVALFLSGIREKSLSSMVAAWELAPEVTAGATTKAQAETKIFEYVRDNLELLVGEPYDPLGSRTADVILKSGKATPMEQVMIMVTLLAASNLTGEIAAIRTEPWGPLQDGMESFAQFQELAVRCGDGDARYYVPYVADAPAGKLPPAWGKCQVIWPKPGLVQAAAQKAAEVMSTPNVDIQAAFSQVREQAAAEGWYTLEEVSGQ